MIGSSSQKKPGMKNYSLAPCGDVLGND